MCKFGHSFTTVLAGLALLFLAIPAGATFPGENGKIVFVGNQSGAWQLYTVNPDGSGMAQITNLPATDFELWLPAFSPDGRQIVFSYGTGSFGGNALAELYLVNADGSALKQLTHDGSFDGFPKWSPDGNSIVFAGNSATGLAIVKTMRSDGTGAQTSLASYFWYSFLPTYAPDGTKIFFDSQLDGLVSAVWIMNPDGSGKCRITAASLEGAPTDVSPDGRRVLLANHENTPLPSSLYTMALNGSDLQQLTNPGTSTDLQAGYSPNGKKIVFVSNRLSPDSSLDLFTMDVDGTNIIRIASGLTVGGCPDSNCVNPNWGPKSKP